MHSSYLSHAFRPFQLESTRMNALGPFSFFPPPTQRCRLLSTHFPICVEHYSGGFGFPRNSGLSLLRPEHYYYCPTANSQNIQRTHTTRPDCLLLLCDCMRGSCLAFYESVARLHGPADPRMYVYVCEFMTSIKTLLVSIRSYLLFSYWNTALSPPWLFSRPICTTKTDHCYVFITPCRISAKNRQFWY